MFSGVLLCTVLCACVVLWWRARVRESRAHPLPPSIRNRLPIIGHLHLILITENLWELMKYFASATMKLGGVAYTNLGIDIYYLITDPEDALAIANTCLGKHFVYSFLQVWLGQGLVTGSVPIWQRHRKLMNPMFSLPIIHGFLEVFNNQSRAFLSNIDPYVGKGKVDLSSHIKTNTLEISCSTAFGNSNMKDKKLLTNYMEAIEQYSRMFIQRFQKFWLHNKSLYKLLGPIKKEVELVRTLKAVTDEVIHKKRLSSIDGTNTEASFGYTNEDIRYQPFVDQMLRQTNKDALTDHEIQEELDTTILAAYDTSYNFVINLLSLVGTYPEVQEKIFEEITHVVGPDRDVEKEDLQKLVYTDAVIKETLRLTPSVPLIARYIDKDVRLKNYTLREGSQCFIFLSGINRHPSWGADADQFRPERWLDVSTLPKNANTFAAFSFGKRSCIGRTYAMTSAKVMLTHVVRKYRLTADHSKMKFDFNGVLTTVAGREISLQRRN